MSNPNSSSYQLINYNEVFNYKFILPNSMNDFPAGWQISRGVANARFCWQRGYRGNYSVAIANCLNDEYSSICQSSACYIPVCEGEEWRVGAVLQVNQGMGASIIVHMIDINGQTSYAEFYFALQAGCYRYYKTITIPENIQLVWLEIGTDKQGVLGIQQVFFSKVDKANDGVVVSRIIEPVKVERKVLNDSEDITATSEQQCSETYNVLYLRYYTYSVINLGTTPAIVLLQSSPDGINFMDEPPEVIVEPNEVKALTCNYFLPFIRLCYRTETGETPLRIFLQGYD
ncbi:MAG: DUF6385 domain-containing protein [Syntrophomonadaceae bacterium]|jgi:hypothetical protein|nr:hypothetical protein [Syntrophomonadaceae bacterium]